MPEEKRRPDYRVVLDVFINEDSDGLSEVHVFADPTLGPERQYMLLCMVASAIAERAESVPDMERVIFSRN